MRPKHFFFGGGEAHVKLIPAGDVGGVNCYVYVFLPLCALVTVVCVNTKAFQLSVAVPRTPLQAFLAVHLGVESHLPPVPTTRSY